MYRIKATANHSKRTFTLRKYNGSELIAKYRTFPMNKEEFESSQINTENDWKQFLTSDEYDVIR